MKTLVMLLWGASLALGLGATAEADGPRNRVSVVGSSTLFPLVSAVAEAFGRQGRWPTPVIESMGTGSGFQAFCRGAGPDTADITDASRPMTDSEARDCASHQVGEVAALRVWSDGILIVNAKGGPALELTREQLYRAIAKRLLVRGQLVPNPHRRWRDVDPSLPDTPILVYGPAPNHGTRDALVALVMGPSCDRQPAMGALPAAARREACESIREDGAWVDVTADYALLLAKIIAEPRAVGVLGYSYLDRNRERIKAARIDGVLPTLESIAEGHYPLSRPLYLYVKAAHVGRIPGLAQFLGEFLGERATGPEGYLVDLGLVPLPNGAREAERRKASALGAGSR
jgi:phosphate transport system substrate-binding protein